MDAIYARVTTTIIYDLYEMRIPPGRSEGLRDWEKPACDFGAGRHRLIARVAAGGAR